MLAFMFSLHHAVCICAMITWKFGFCIKYIMLFLIGKQHFSDITLKRTMVTVHTVCCEIKILLDTTSSQHTHAVCVHFMYLQNKK